MKREQITFITGNPSKAEQLSRHLNIPVNHKKLDLKEIQSLDLEEVVREKAYEAYRQAQETILVEDTSLKFLALGNLPGPFIKWFLTELGNDGLCKLLDSYSDRSALAQVRFGLFDGKKLETFYGEMEGRIAEVPRGEKGFGWDSIFIPEGSNKTWGEMDIEEQAQTSMRKIALKKLQTYLEGHR